MTPKPVLLKVLLRQRHLQGHPAFNREYDKVAATIDKALVGTGPGKAQFYRWLAGELIGLPYGHHCRVLEGMFPDWTAEQLFQSYNGGLEFVPEPRRVTAPPAETASAPGERRVPAEVVALYPHRADTPKALWLDLSFGSGREHRSVRQCQFVLT